eukprot:6530139-Heterocapsa_arctica.AAC.1
MKHSKSIIKTLGVTSGRDVKVEQSLGLRHNFNNSPNILALRTSDCKPACVKPVQFLGNGLVHIAPRLFDNNSASLDSKLIIKKRLLKRVR